MQWDGNTKTIVLTIGGSPTTTPSDPVPAPATKADPAKNRLVGFYVGIRIPGAAYVTDFAWSSVLTISPSVMTSSTLLISPDGSYAWNSSWDGRLIEGTWGTSDGNIVLYHAQEGKDWTVESANTGGVRR